MVWFVAWAHCVAGAHGQFGSAEVGSLDRVPQRRKSKGLRREGPVGWTGNALDRTLLRRFSSCRFELGCISLRAILGHDMKACGCPWDCEQRPGYLRWLFVAHVPLRSPKHPIL
ncbi:unnamed protein product [Ostreobium quekettii]|uniref:Secreted protein n=1 Tax=Ostreobium quekettii TaxID=121088 RepID=A0A8S1IQC4_9CHLO|nr:unnamed protein product [Ostreobium quekettii]